MHATELRRHHDIPFEVAVDDIDGVLHRALTPKPNSAYLLDPAGTSRYRAHWANDERGLRSALSACAQGRTPARDLLVLFIPGSAVNPADYFLVRRGNYDIASFFTAHGAYGRYAWRGLLAYGIGLAAKWPFVAQPDYTGPLVSTLGGADISWLIGWFAAAIAYFLLTALPPAPAPASPFRRQPDKHRA